MGRYFYQHRGATCAANSPYHSSFSLLPTHCLPMMSSSSSASVSATRVPSEILVGLLMPPVLLGILAARALADGLTQAGLASEQLFAGERLPNLNVSPASPDRSDPAGEY